MISNPDNDNSDTDDTLERLELPDLPKTEPTIDSEEGKKLFWHWGHPLEADVKRQKLPPFP